MSINMTGPKISDAVFNGGEPMHPVVPRTIEWYHIDDVTPPDDRTVLVATCARKAQGWDYDAVFEAFYDGEVWVEAATGHTVVDGAITHLAYRPAGPHA